MFANIGDLTSKVISSEKKLTVLSLLPGQFLSLHALSKLPLPKPFHCKNYKFRNQPISHSFFPAL